MNIKYTLLKPLSGKLDDYIMILGKWVEVIDKSKTLILKHGVLSQLEYNYIVSREKARFKWDDKNRQYILCVYDGDNPRTLSRLILDKRNDNLYKGVMIKGVMIKGIFSWDVSRIWRVDK